jgi:colanic acid/amylovoran biosynthesis glycosyltransferase
MLPLQVESQESDSSRLNFQVAFVTSTYPFGRGEAFLTAELAALCSLGCEPLLFAVNPKSTRRRHHQLAANAWRLPPLSLQTVSLAIPEMCRSLKACLRELSAILCSDNSWIVKTKNLALLPAAFAIRALLRGRQVQHIHAYWASGPATVGLIVSNLTGIPFSFSGHSWDILAENNLIRTKIASAKFVRVISERGQKALKGTAGIASTTPIEVIHLGVADPPAPSGAPFTKPSKHSQSVKLLCPAFFEPFKGHVYLLEALALLSRSGLEYHCDLVGDGPLRRSLIRVVENLGLTEQVRFVGHIPHQALLDSLWGRKYDLVVLASVEIGNIMEGIPVALMEAMAAGIPCVTTRSGAIQELVDSSCGILVPQRNVPALATAIAKLAQDPKYRERLGRQAQERIKCLFDARVSAKRLLDLMSSK